MKQQLFRFDKSSCPSHRRQDKRTIRVDSYWKCMLFVTILHHVVHGAHSESGSGSSSFSSPTTPIATTNTNNLNPTGSPDTAAAGGVEQAVFWPETFSFDDDDDDDNDGGGGDDELSSSSDAEYEGWGPFGYPVLPVEELAPTSTQQNPSPGTNIPLVPTEKPKPKTGKSASKKSSLSAVESRPLKTIEKLRQMLDDTDYITSRPDDNQGHGHHYPFDLDGGDDHATELEGSLLDLQKQQPAPPSLPELQDRLWTSADRSKYKRQQQRLRRQQVREEQRTTMPMPPPPPPPPPPPQQLRTSPSMSTAATSTTSSDDDLSDTDDGLEYTLPNLPVYLSDAEGDSETEEFQEATRQQQTQQQTQQQQQHLPHPPQGTVLLPDHLGYSFYPPQTALSSPPYPPELYGHQPPYQQSSYPASNMHPPNAYGQYPYPPPYSGPYNPQQQQQQQQHAFYAAQQYAAWASAAGYLPPRPYGPMPPQSWAQSPPATIENNKRSGATTSSSREGKSRQIPNVENTAPKLAVVLQPELSSSNNQQTLAEASSRINFDSIQKISLMLAIAAMTCYSAVSPRALPPVEYNRLFYDNVRLVALTLIAPVITFFSVLDAAQNDLNEIIQAFYMTFTVGYILAFLLEILSTTLVRLSVFLLFEQDVFGLVPEIPVLVLPWVLRENMYRPKRITIMAADFLTSCVVCPFLEEYIKLKILQWTARLPKNYTWVKKSGKKKKKWKREKVVGEKEVTTVNKYVMQMLAVSMGLKLADAGRRVLMYTKPYHADKSFYAICRGIFPLHELCGTMTALRLAKRDVLGAEMSTWWILAPAVIVHGMATLRGMKPIFKWNSATPWSEMQLFPWSSADASTLPQLATKGFSKLMWLIILLRALGYCAKNYYYTNRQAQKRTTTYASNPCAVDAALASSDLLKKTQKN